MSGITAAAQSSGCCCRPVEGCTCESPTRPGAVFDRSLTAISVTGEVTVDHAYLSNGSSSQGCGCPCNSIHPIIGSGSVTYGYRTQGSVTDPSFLTEDDPCYPGCTSNGCAGCSAFRLSAATSTVICLQGTPGVAQWSSRVLQFGDNFAGQWTWRGRRVGYCIAGEGQNFARVRSYCPFLYIPVNYPTSGIDPSGAFIDVSTGAYVSTPYGETLGRLHAVQYATVMSVPTIGGSFCGYTIRLGIALGFTWDILRALAEDGEWLPGFALPTYYADYFKPCLSPSDTVLGTYQIGDVPDYDISETDSECGSVRSVNDLRVDFPQEIDVS